MKAKVTDHAPSMKERVQKKWSAVSEIEPDDPEPLEHWRLINGDDICGSNTPGADEEKATDEVRAKNELVTIEGGFNRGPDMEEPSPVAHAEEPPAQLRVRTHSFRG